MKITQRLIGISALLVLTLGIMSFVSVQDKGQSPFVGVWEGTLSQPSGRGMVISYPFAMKIEEQGGKIIGVSRIDIEKTSYFAIMDWTGRLDSPTTLHFQELPDIKLHNTPSGMIWYIKRGALHYNAANNSLTGTWSEKSVGDSGTIALYRSNKKSISK